MKNELSTTKKASEIPATVTDAKLFQEGNNLLFFANQLGLAKLLFECAAIYNYQKSGAFSEDCKGDFLQSIGMSIRSAQVRLKIARLMQLRINRIIGFPPSPSEFYFTEQAIKETFGQYFEKRRNVGITDLLNASRDVMTFTNFLEGNTDIKESEVAKLLTSGKEKDEVAQPQQNDLFTMHNRMKSDGWEYINGEWINPKTKLAMTRAELAQYVDEGTGLHLFTSTKKMLEDMHEKILAQKIYVEYVHAYWEAHRSPEMDRLMDEEQKKLAALASEIQDTVTTILFEEEN